MSGSNYTPGIGGLALNRYEFQNFLDGYVDRLNASSIDVSPPVIVNSVSYTTVSTALAAIVGEVAGNFIAAGDLSGDASSQTVVGLRGIPISSTAPSTNNILVYTGGQWTPSAVAPSPPSGSAGGNLGGTYPNPTVTQINGASVPTIGSTGNLLYVSGGSSLSYGPLNLAGGSAYITGTLPSGNQDAQTMGGDISGTSAASTVIGLQGVSISNTVPTSNQVLQYNSGTSEWTPATLTVGTLSGDVTGAYGSNTVISLAGSGGKVTANTNIIPGTDNTYTLGNSSYRWEYLYMGDGITWPSTFIPSSCGTLGMDQANSSGRPHAFIDGYDHGLSSWRAYFGDGSDGNGVCNGSLAANGMNLLGGVYTLDRDCFFTNLTVSSGAEILLDGYRLFINGILNIGSGCTVGVPGNNAINNTGVAGAGTTIGSVLGGSAGGTGSTGSGGNGTSSINAIGGSGGHGGTGGGSDGTGGVVTNHTAVLGSLNHAPEALLGAIYSGGVGVWTPISGGCGGGAGAGASGTTGGGGGGGGGVAIIATRIITGAGSITVIGGTGGNSSGSGNGDGGGGGGGGLIILVYGDKSSFTGSIIVSGGAGGSGINAGVAGASGSAGTTILLPA